MPSAVQQTFDTVLAAIAAAQPDVLNVATGNPFVPPNVTAIAVDALAQWAARPRSRDEISTYSVDTDEGPLIESSLKLLRGFYGVEITAANLLVCPGAQLALNLISLAARRQHQRLFWPAPFEFPQAIFAQTNFSHPPVEFRRTRTPLGVRHDLEVGCLGGLRAPIFVISTPHNPTGSVWPESVLRWLAHTAASSGGWLVLDETYGFPAAPLAPILHPVHGPGILHLLSFSKIGLAGERLGLIWGDADAITRLRVELRRLIIQSPRAIQHAGAALVDAFTSEPSLGRSFAVIYEERWRYLSSLLADESALEGTEIAEWKGGPFLWLEWGGAPDDLTVFHAALRLGVAVMPGAACKTPGSCDTFQSIRIGLGGALDALPTVARVVGRALSLSTPSNALSPKLRLPKV